MYVYGVVWDAMEDDLNNMERTKRCQVRAIVKLLKEMANKFPENVHILSVASTTTTASKNN